RRPPSWRRRPAYGGCSPPAFSGVRNGEGCGRSPARGTPRSVSYRLLRRPPRRLRPPMAAPTRTPVHASRCSCESLQAGTIPQRETRAALSAIGRTVGEICDLLIEVGGGDDAVMEVSEIELLVRRMRVLIGQSDSEQHARQ